MRVRERILILRLLGKIREDPAYAEALGITAVEPELHLDRGAS